MLAVVKYGVHGHSAGALVTEQPRVAPAPDLCHDVDHVARAVGLCHDDGKLMPADGRHAVKHDAGLLNDVDGTTDCCDELPLRQNGRFDRALDLIRIEDHGAGGAVPPTGYDGDDGQKRRTPDECQQEFENPTPHT